MRDHLPGTRIHLVLRDILDDPSLLIPSWKELGAFKALEDYYDRIFVCGHPWIYDPTKEYGFPPSLQSRVKFCGYLERSFDEKLSDSIRSELTTDGQKLVVVTAGGGADGEQLIGTFLGALQRIRAHKPVTVVLLLGPEMGRAQARLLTASVEGDPGVRVLDFSENSVAYMAAADLIVSMGGYNTINEIMWLRKPAIVTPRVQPRREQLIRTRRMAELGLLEMIHPRDLTGDSMAASVVAALSRTPQIPVVPVRFCGADEVAREVELSLLQKGRSERPVAKKVSARG